MRVEGFGPNHQGVQKASRTDLQGYYKGSVRGTQGEASKDLGGRLAGFGIKVQGLGRVLNCKQRQRETRFEISSCGGTRLPELDVSSWFAAEVLGLGFRVLGFRVRGLGCRVPRCKLVGLSVSRFRVAT